MTSYFVDSSALVKRYVHEQGTTWIRSLTLRSAGHTILIAQITPVEIFSGISRRKRENQIPVRAAQAIRIVMNRHVQHEYMVIGLTERIIQQAQDLLHSYPLRAYDSIQLSSALTANTRLVASGQQPLIFVSADTRLLSVATAQSLTVDDPNAHP